MRRSRSAKDVKTKINKAITHNWDIISNMSNVRELRALTQQQQAVLVALAEYLGWSTRWENPPSNLHILQEFADETKWAIMADICDELVECLEPLFDELNDKIDALDAISQVIREIVLDVKEVQQLHRLEPIPPVSAGDKTASAIYAGAVAVVETIHQELSALYEQAEASVIDNLHEMISIFWDLFPRVGDMPLDETLALGNAFFENQVHEYHADYPALLPVAACDLYCRITVAGQFDFEVWGAWLYNLRSLLPGNRAADVFSRIAPLSRTWLNELVHWLKGSPMSLEQYFKKHYAVFAAAALSPIPVPSECDCVNIWEHVFDFVLSDGGWVTSTRNPSSFSASYVAGSGWRDTNSSTTTASIGFEIFYEGLVNSATLDDVEIEYSLSHVGTVKKASLTKTDNENSMGGDELMAENTTIAAGNAQTVNLTIKNASLDRANMRVQMLTYLVPSGASFTLHKLTLRGTGNNPFE